MAAELMIDERHVLAENAFVEIVVWRLPRAMLGSIHRFKYRLALVEDGICVLRYDNEAGKGDHRHEDEEEQPYHFTTVEVLLTAFWSDVDARRR